MGGYGCETWESEDNVGFWSSICTLFATGFTAAYSMPYFKFPISPIPVRAHGLHTHGMTVFSFCVVSGDIDGGPHTCVASDLHTKLSPKLLPINSFPAGTGDLAVAEWSLEHTQPQG